MSKRPAKPHKPTDNRHPADIEGGAAAAGAIGGALVGGITSGPPGVVTGAILGASLGGATGAAAKESQPHSDGVRDRAVESGENS